MDMLNSFVALTFSVVGAHRPGGVVWHHRGAGRNHPAGRGGNDAAWRFRRGGGGLVHRQRPGGALCSVVVGILTGWLYGLFCLKWKAQQSVVGVGVNLFASGATAVLLKAIWQAEGMSESVASIPNITVPVLNKIPVIGGLSKSQSPYLYLDYSHCGGGLDFFYKTKYGCATGPSATSPLRFSPAASM